MELKELTQNILKFFKVDSHSELPGRSMQILESPGCHDIFKPYLELCPDLSVDWLQRVYQFYCADRKEKKPDYTPVALSRILARFTYSDSVKTLYDCCAGSGSLTIQQWLLHPDAHFICEELDGNMIPILLFNLAIRNMNATVIQKNILTGEVRDSWDIRRGSVFSSISKPMFAVEEGNMADVAVSNPPFNLNGPVSESLRGGFDKITGNFAFVERCIQRTTGRAALILPMGVCTSKQEEPFRRRLVELGVLEAVVAMPERMFESTPVSTCILLLNKEKRSKDVMLVDASTLGSVEERKQRGEGDASHFNRIYTKKFNTFNDDQIMALCDLLGTEQKDYSKSVSLEELKEHDFSFSLGPYKEIDPIPNTLHRDFNEIIRDLNHIIHERNVLRISVNKVWAKELGLTELIEQCSQSAEISRSLNQSLNFKNYKVAEPILEDGYIKESNNKIFCIENIDKSKLSSIMPFFMNMWKQHIYFLNNEENRLLAELRNAMLPYLMSGDLEITDAV